MHDKIEAALLAHFHGPGYNAAGHGTPDDCAPCHEATHVALAAIAAEELIDALDARPLVPSDARQL